MFSSLLDNGIVNGKDLNIAIIPIVVKRRRFKIYDLVLMTTTDKEVLNKELKDCILMFSLYQRYFSCKGVVFTDSKPVMEFASAHKVATINNATRNKFGLPIIRSFFEMALDTYNASFYGYLNSDVVLNPRIFSLLHNVTKWIKQGTLSPYLELGSRVRMTTSFLKPRSFINMATFGKAMNARHRTVIRNDYSADIFIFARTFPFEKIPPAVVGREKIDNILLQIPKQINGMLVDLTFFAPNYHQGFDGYVNHNYTQQTIADRQYNIKYASWPMGAFFSHGKYSIESDGSLRVIHKKTHFGRRYSFLL